MQDSQGLVHSLKKHTMKGKNKYMMELTKTPHGLYEINFGINQKATINEADAKVLMNLLETMFGDSELSPNSVKRIISPETEAYTIPSSNIDPPFVPAAESSNTQPYPFGSHANDQYKYTGKATGSNVQNPNTVGSTIAPANSEFERDNTDTPSDVVIPEVPKEYTPSPVESYKDKSYNKRKNK